MREKPSDWVSSAVGCKQLRILFAVIVVLLIVSVCILMKNSEEMSDVSYMLPIPHIISDELISDGIVLGRIDSTPGKSYVVFSAVADESMASKELLFLLPVTAQAWKLIGFDSVVVLVGSPYLWYRDKAVQLIVLRLRQLNAVIIFLETRPVNAVLISQVSGIFVGNILRRQESSRRVIDGIFLITSDAGFWPHDGAIYKLAIGKDIVVLNSDCCGSFNHRNSTYQMLSMSHVGMNIGTWHQLSYRFGFSPSSADDMLSFIRQEFGPDAIQRADSASGHTDRRLLSILVSYWSAKDGNLNRTCFVA